MTGRTATIGSGTTSAQFVVFAGHRRIAAGDLAVVAAAAWRVGEEDPHVAALVFDRESAEVVDLDLRGGQGDVVARYTAAIARKAVRGRPNLGVVSREITLLPRHWDWLASQPGGASATLRRLVETARKSDTAAAVARSYTAYRFMAAVAGDLPGFEEATRALFAGDGGRLTNLISQWPADIGDEVLNYLDSPAPNEVS